MKVNHRPMHRATIKIIVLCAALSCSSCFWRKRAAVMPPPKVFIPPPEPRRIPLAPPDLGAPPDLEPETPIMLAGELEIPTPEILPPPRHRKPRRVRPGPPPRDEREEESEAESEEPAPQLVQMLSPEKRREYDQRIDQNLSQAQKSLSAVAGRPLSPEQIDSANLIQAFIRQAQQAREQDPVRAQSLAERASVLAQHLEKSVR